MLQNEESLCEEHQRIIVSHDRKSGNQCEHIGKCQVFLGNSFDCR